MMTREQFLLLKMMEEAAEVSQRASKAIRFGLDEIQSGQTLDNAERLVDELLDLFTVMRLLQDKLPQPADERVEERIAKIEKYCAMSKAQGRVE